MNPFDPSKLKKHSIKGSFGVKTQKSEIDDSQSVVLRAQQDFLTTRLSKSLRNQKGCFTLPRLYTINGKQVHLYMDALKSIGADLPTNISGEYSIDKTGYCPNIYLSSIDDNSSKTEIDHLKNNFIFISSDQIGMSIINPRFSFLNRLLTEIENTYEQTIVSFNRGEAVLGDICNVIIDEGVERFIKEKKYKDKEAIYLNIALNTPNKAMDGYREIKKSILEIEKKPEIITDKNRITHLYGLAGKIKSNHKKLNDLVLPENPEITYPVECFQYSDQNFELFYFFKDKPIFIFFAIDESGETINDYFDDEFIILNGNNRSSLLNNLLDLEILDFLVENIESIRDTNVKSEASLFSGIKAITGNAQSDLSEEWHELNDVVSTLRMSDAGEIYKKTGNETETNEENNTNLENARQYYIKSLNPNLKSKIVFPRSDAEDNLICRLISKCSSSDSIKLYGDSKEFISKFKCMADNEKIKLLKEIDGNMYFENQNNLLINYWLEKNQNEICKNAGIKFSLN